MRHLLRTLVLSLAFAAPPGTAADYPSKPIRFLVGVVPGGAADTLTRALGRRLSERLGQQVVVDHRPGANQTIAAEMTAKATPDGHTMLIVPSGHAINPSIYRLRYDSVKDFSGHVVVTPHY
ncbi:MAG: hypothetical protein HYU76_14410 [Betaproteobacteria bacterium]|nr:hypothetical protein [Betaproteobacteria bacterium]